MTLVSPLLSCGPNGHAEYERVWRMFVRGDLARSQQEAETDYRRFLNSDPDLAWKFRILEADALSWRGKSEEVVALFESSPPPPALRNIAVQARTLQGVALAHLHNFPEADRKLTEAQALCPESTDPTCGGVMRARGVLAMELGDFPQAKQFFEQSLLFARAHSDRLLEATALLNIGAASLAQGHLDEAVNWSDRANQSARALGARDLSQNAAGNLGWSFYKLGDSEKALGLFLEAQQTAQDLGDVGDQASWLTDAGYIYMDRRDFSLAERSFRKALDLATEINSKEDIYNAQRVLARLALQTGDIDKASEYADQAMASARASGNHLDELYPLLVQGQIAARRGDTADAEQRFTVVEQDENCPAFLKWETQHSLARLYEDENRPDLADRQYQAALATFEAARSDVRHEDSHLSFLTNGWRIYDDYIHFLVARGKSDDALRWADYSRARTLAEGLGIPPAKSVAGPPPLRAQEIARGVKGTLLFYWLGENQSYLWAISPRGTGLIPLPPGPEIDAAVQRYRKTLLGPQDALASGDGDGRWLYRTLVAPAQQSLHKDARVFIVPDGSLNNLNFETLLVGEPAPHYWIEDATITNASSLRVLATSYQSDKRRRSLLLIGNSVPPNDKYPALPNASAQMDSVAGYFPAAQEQIFARGQASARAYLGSHPEQFSHIHFVAHGIASRLSPLDSAIVLSKSGPENDSFKLYGRDIIQHPLRADLVTISACYGAGERWYSGEGLVGLSWAFLRAGAHNVVAALWEVADASVEKLMARFYEELDHGGSPDTALRAAKLSLLHSKGFRNPFYWATFQLYTQGRPANSHNASNLPSSGTRDPGQSKR